MCLLWHLYDFCKRSTISNNKIILAQADTGKEFQTFTSGLEKATYVDKLAFSSDGTLLAATVTVFDTTSSSTVIIWNTQTGEKLLTLRPEEAASAPETMSWAFMSTDFSPDANILATGLFGSQIILWNTETGERLRDLQDLENAFGTIDDLDWNPDGSLLATGHRGGIVAMWNPDSGELLHSYESDARYAYRVKWSPDGNYLAAGLSLLESSMAHILILDVEGEILDTLETHDESVSTIAWSPDGQTFVASSSNEVLFWTVSVGP